MREIIFKGKRKDNGEWIEGSLITSINVYLSCLTQIKSVKHYSSPVKKLRRSWRR
jgi:hypothetical protein|nr:MAG TPA: hypothetical protein [Caudoviricetes sp.]